VHPWWQIITGFEGRKQKYLSAIANFHWFMRLLFLLPSGLTFALFLLPFSLGWSINLKRDLRAHKATLTG
jgi:hypothetical protein